jgi:hypothetical protein
MSDVAIRWDWSPEEFHPPFTIKDGQGLYLRDGLPTEGPGVVSVMARAPQLAHQEGKWYVVSAYNVPKDQLRATATSLKAMCEMKWHEHIESTNQQESNHEL